MRSAMLEGKLPLPGERLLKLYPKQADDIERFWRVVWFNYLNENETNSLHWYEELGIKVYNDVLRRLCHNGWIKSKSLTGRNWASLELRTEKLLDYVDVDELEQIKTKYKYSKYVLSFALAKSNAKVRQNGKVKFTGLVRKGFMDSGNTQFGYDMEALNSQKEAVVKNLIKSMDKIRNMYPEMKNSSSCYDNVSVGIYDWHSDNSHEVFTTGESYIDSRGRAISSSLSKVANPISNKDFRAALVITYD